MGGNIWPKLSRRFAKKEFFELQYEICSILEPYMVRFSPTSTYTTKASFGDLDCIYCPKPDFNITMLNRLFCTDYVKANGPCTSFLYKELQVDLIRSTEEEFLACLDYHDNSDYGNIRGKVIHKFGLKYGHDGLSLPVRSANNTIGTIMLSQDPVEINEMFGFKLAEFETLEEMFESVIGSYFFNPTVFAWEQMNATSRTRDKKRTTYHAFLEYINGKDYPFQYEFDPDKSSYLPWIFENFPLKKPEYDALWARKELLESAAEKFNGNLVRFWLGVEGVELGNLMRNLKPIMTAERVLDLSETELRNIVYEMYINLKETK
jgi:hypothetical protein